MSEDGLNIIQSDDGLAADVRRMIAQTREGVARTVNAGMTLLYWRVGKRIHQEILAEKRANYGKQIVASLGRQLATEFGSGFGEKNLRRMVQFAETFPDEAIVAALRRQLGWTHFKALIPIKDPLKRDFYAEMCRVERWSTRTLASKVDSMLYERTAISKKPAEVAKAELAALRADDRLTPDLVFRDPYILDFLGLKDRYLEKDPEDAILRELETFLLELGNGFAFLGRQSRIQIDSDDFYLDLLFYHRTLKRIIAIDLKLGDFCALPTNPNVDQEIQAAAEQNLAVSRQQDPIQNTPDLQLLHLPEIDLAAIETLLGSGMPDLAAAAAERVQAHLQNIGDGSERWVAEGMARQNTVTETGGNTCFFLRTRLF